MTGTPILILLGITLTFAFIFAGIIAFSIRSRSKKGKMKHGTLSSNQNNALPNEQPPSQLPVSTASITEIGAEHKHPSAFPVASTAGDDDLNMDILNNLGGAAKSRDNTQPVDPEPVDLNSRLESSPPPSPPVQPQEPVELLRLLRDPQSGQLIVQIGEQRYHKLTEVADKKIGQFILKLAAQLLAFTNGRIVTEAGLKSVYNPKVGQTPEPVVDNASPADTAAAPLEPKAPQQSQPTPPPQPPPITSSLSPSPLPESSSSRGLFGIPKPSPGLPSMLPAINLAREINDIVQNRLLYSPLGQTTKIDIISAPDGGIRINVNGSFYSTPDEVPDPDVKALIKESIKQWERS